MHTYRVRIHAFFFSLLIALPMAMLIVLPARAEQEFLVDPQLFDSTQADRIILVTYTDKHIDRIPVGVANQSYRRRGEYSSSTWGKRVASSIEADYKLTILSQWPIREIGEHCVVYLIDEDQSVDAIIKALSEDDRVDNVQTMSTFKVMANSYSDPYYRLQFNIQSMNLAEIHHHATGKNVTIAIIDTGIDATHPDLQGQIQQTKDFVTRKSPESFNDLHGTAIAGVIAAKANNGQGIVGIAPDSHVIGLKACWEIKTGSFEAACNSFTLALALNTAIQMKVDVLNLSLTGPHDPLLARLIDKAVQKGMIIIASQADRNDSKSGFPAQQAGVIAVRSTHNTIMPSSHDSDAIAISAPGQEILTTLPKGAYDFVSGNSLATAHVSGLTALLLQINRNLTHQEISRLLEKANEPTFYQLFNKNKMFSTISVKTSRTHKQHTGS